MARSAPLAPNVGRLSRSQVAAKRGLHKGKSCPDLRKLESTTNQLRKEDLDRCRQGGRSRPHREEDWWQGQRRDP